jgi:hypothetical protein
MPYTFPKYLYCVNSADYPGAGVILCTEAPHIIGHIIKHKSREDIVKYSGTHVYYQVSGYYIIICLLSPFTLQGERNFTSAEIDHIRETIFPEMAAFYTEEKIKKNLSYYKRYQVK